MILRRDPVGERVAAALVDGTPVAWPEAIAAAVDQSDEAIVRCLKDLAALRVSTCDSDAHVRFTPKNDSSTASSLVALVSAVKLLAVLLIAAAAVLAGSTADGQSFAPPLFQLAVMSGFAAAAVFLLGAARDDIRAVALAASYAATAAAFAHPLHIAALAAWPLMIGVWLRDSALYPEAFLPATSWAFASRFPRASRFERFDRASRGIERAMWWVGAGLFAANVALAALGPSAGAGWLVLIQNRRPENVFWFILSIPMSAAVAAVALRSWRAAPEERLRVKRFALVFASCSAPFFLHAIIRLAWPEFDRWLRVATPGERGWLDALMLGGLVVLPIGTAVVIVSDRALEVAVTRTMQYLLTRRIASLISFAPVALLCIHLFRSRERSLAELFAGAQGPMLTAFALAGLALFVLQDRLRAAVDRWFGVGVNNRTWQLSGALERARAARGQHELVFTVTREIEQRLNVSFAAVLVRAANEGFVDPFGTAITVPPGSALESILDDAETHIDLSPESQTRRLLPRAERDRVGQLGIHGMTPIRQRDGTTTGVIVTGARRSGLPLASEDMWWVGSLAGLMSLASNGPGQHTSQQDQSSIQAAFECPACGLLAASPSLGCACGEPAIPAALPAVVSGKFALKRRLGRGGMGVVYLAHDRHLGRDVAIKTLPHVSASAIAQLKSEARTMAAIAHPGLATIYGIEVWSDTPALVVEYCAEGTLADRLACGRVEPGDALRIGIQLCAVLAYLHERGFTHGDVKPSNIGVAANGAIKLLDFGLSAPPRAEPSEYDPGDRPEQVGGTPMYMAPESFAGADDPTRRDLWAAALVVFEIASQSRAIPAAMPSDIPRLLARELPRRLKQAAIDTGLKAVLSRALRLDPLERFPDARALQEALERLRPTQPASF